MNSKKLISEALFTLAKTSTTEIIDATEDKELINAASKIGIVVPSPDLSVLKTIYAEIDKVNLNGIVLPKEAVEKGLPTLVGKNINWEHDGAGRICGYIIDAKINDNKIEIIGVVFKSLFPEEMDAVKEKFAEHKLAVSFEIWNRNPEDGTSVIHDLANGFRAIDPITFHGCGLLLVNPPACPKAKVYKLIAQQEVIKEEKEDKIFEENLICASMAIEEPKCKNCGTCTCKKEESKVEELIENDYEGVEFEEAKKLTTEQRNALPDSDFALIQEKDGKKIRRFPINDEAHVRNALARLPQAKDITEEEKKSALEKIIKRAKELKMDELVKKYEKAEEKPAEEAKERLCPECKQPMKEDEKELCAECLKKKEQAAITEVKAEETKPAEAGTETKTEETKVEEKKEVVAQEVKEIIPKKLVTVINEETVIITDTMDGKVEKKGVRKTTRKFDDGTEEVLTEEYQVVDTYTQAQLEEKVNAVKTEKDAEITNLKTEHERIVAEKDNEIKVAKEDISKKEQEIATLKTPPVEEKKTGLTVGSVAVEKDSEVKKQAQNVNDIISAAHKNR
jgi:hypothetical protein